MSKASIILRWCVVVIVCISGIWFCRDLKIGDDALDLLPGEAVSSDIGLLQEMGLVDRVFITVSTQEQSTPGGGAVDPELLGSVDRLVETLQQHEEFSFVLGRLPGGYEQGLVTSLREMIPFLLDASDYAVLEKKISTDGIADVLRNDFALLNSPAGIALKNQVRQDPLGLLSLAMQKLKHLRSEFSMDLADGYFVSRDRTSCLVMVQSRLSLTDSEQAARVEDILDHAFSTSLGAGIRAGVIGTLPHTLANSRTIQDDLKTILPAASGLLLLLLGWGLRSLRGVLILGVVFLAAPPAIGFTASIYSPMSRLALGFGIVLLGIAVDFAIHLYLALSQGGESRAECLARVRRPIMYATLTTLAVLGVILFSEVPSHRQMATLALAGIVLAVLFSWLTIPTLAVRGTAVMPHSRGIFPSFAQVGLTGKIGVVLWVAVVMGGIAAWPELKYNGDLRVLDAPDQKVLAEEARFNDTWGEKGEQAFIIVQAQELDTVLDLNSQVYEQLMQLTSGTFQSFAPLLPGPAKRLENLGLWKQFWGERRADFEAQFMEQARSIGFSRSAFLPFFAYLDREPVAPEIRSFINGPLAPLFLSMLSRVESPVQEGAGKFLALSTVALDDTLLSRLAELDENVAGATVIANKKWRAKVEHLLRHDIFTLSLAAGCVIILLVWLQFRRTRTVVAVLAPVVSALSAMIIYSWITGSALNMMHLIMGILVIGLSVDYGIFVVCTAMGAGDSYTGKAVSICAASSMIGFGVLAFAAHPALHALGITVLVGIGVAWPTAIWVSPVVLGRVNSAGGYR